MIELSADAQYLLDNNLNPYDKSPNGPQVKTYRTRAGKLQVMPSFELNERMDEEGEGFCLACGEQQTAEPDMARGECECCGANKVYGAAELALLGLVF